MLPDGVIYHASWIDPTRARCFQVMEAADESALQPWLDAWSDIVQFDVIPVLASSEYWATVAGSAGDNGHGSSQSASRGD